MHTVPHFETAVSGPLHHLEEVLLAKQPQIEAWFRNEWQKSPPPIYASVDLRNAGFKVAPIDTNLFPAGFNNLSPEMIPLGVQAVQTSLERICPEIKKVLIIPESHTRNRFYLESLSVLQSLCLQAGFETRVGTLIDSIEDSASFETMSGKSLTLERIRRVGNRIQTKDFDPCLIILNHDLSGGHSELLNDIEQPITPPLALGWSKRLKSAHFSLYRDIASEFSALVNIDDWLVSPLFRNCGEINFKTREGEDCLERQVNTLIEDITKKYEAYQITDKPFTVVKADAGTYGMAVMTVYEGSSIRQLNRKQRHSMATTKGGQSVSKAIVQEGIYSIETMGDKDSVAEPVIYLVGPHVVGGFYRIHDNKRSDESLNAPGMHFKPMPMMTVDPTQPNRFYVYGVVARLAVLAAAREVAMTTEEVPWPFA